MQYIRLGQSGLQVSRLCLGTMNMGTPDWKPWIFDEKQSEPIVAHALDHGVNFIDLADFYSAGVGEEVVGPAGPTTSTRMDKFTETMLGQTGLLAMIGKAERGPVAIESIKKHRSAYLMAVGGAAYLVSKAIKHAKVLAFQDLGMEAIYEFDVEDMPVTVAVDSTGTSMHQTGPREWQLKIGKIPVTVA